MCLVRPLANAYPAQPPAENVTGIIALGGTEDGMRKGLPNVNMAAARYTEARVLAERFPTARFLVSGRSGCLCDLGQGEIGEEPRSKAFFLRHGFPSERLILETESRNTAENASHSMLVANPQQDEVWVLVTSAYHMRRSVRSFERAGWTGVVPWPVD